VAGEAAQRLGHRREGRRGAQRIDRGLADRGVARRIERGVFITEPLASSVKLSRTLCPLGASFGSIQRWYMRVRICSR